MSDPREQAIEALAKELIPQRNDGCGHDPFKCLCFGIFDDAPCDGCRSRAELAIPAILAALSAAGPVAVVDGEVRGLVEAIPRRRWRFLLSTRTDEVTQMHDEDSTASFMEPIVLYRLAPAPTAEGETNG